MTPSELGDKLNRFSNLIGVRRKETSQPRTPPRRYQRMADCLGGSVVDSHAGSYCLVRRHYGFDYCHGSLRLSDLPNRERPLPVSAFTPLDEPGEVDLNKLIFFDTETTGLGGAGAVPFLVGCGSFVEDGFEVRQYVIPDYSDEAAMLEALLDEITEERTIVTYNGKAFDLPIVQDRMIVNRVARELPFGNHLDLLHAGRRLYRRRLADCSLTNIEREILDFYRSDDIPGYLIPSVYFDWLGEERLDQMESVLEHNRLDIVSLAFLAVHFADVFHSEGSVLNQPEDLHSLARVYGRRKDNERVVRLYEQIEGSATKPPDDDVVLFHAFGYKRIGDWKRAVELWESLVDRDGRPAVVACIELAKYHEHKTREFEQALAFTRTASMSRHLTPVIRRQIESRLRRLQNKLNR